MRIVCDSCGAVYKIADDKLVKEVNKATCKRCGHKIIIRKPRAATSNEGPSERTVISSAPGMGAGSSSPPASASEEKKEKDEKTVITTIPELEKYESAAVSAGAIGSLTSELRTISATADIPEPSATESLGPNNFQGFEAQSQVSEPPPMPEMPKPPPAPSMPSPPPMPAAPEPAAAPAAPSPPPMPAAPEPPPTPAPTPSFSAPEPAPVPEFSVPAAPTPPPAPSVPPPPVAPAPPTPEPVEAVEEPEASPAEISIAIPPESGPLFQSGEPEPDRLAPPPVAPTHDALEDADLAGAINQPAPAAVTPEPPQQAGEVRSATRDMEPAAYQPKGEFLGILFFCLMAMAGLAAVTVAPLVPKIGIISTVGLGLIWSAVLAIFLVSLISGLGRKKGYAFVMLILGLMLGFGLSFGLNFGLSLVTIGTEAITELPDLPEVPTPPVDGTEDTTPAEDATPAEDGTADGTEDATPAEDATPEPATPEEPPVEAAAENPAIIFASSPGSADIYMDGRKLGRASYRYESGRAGKRYYVTCKKSGYEDGTASGIFPSGGSITVRCSMKKSASEPATPKDDGGSSGLPDPSEVLTPAVIEAIVGSNAAIKRCFAEASARGDTTSGKIWVKFTVSPSGKVSKARIVTADYAGTDLDSCVSGQINRLQFAPFSGSTAKTIKYPFVVR